MDRHIPVPFLEPIVFLNIMQIVPSDDNCSLHLHFLHHARQNPTSNGYVASEWTLLVEVSAIGRLSWNFEPKPNRFDMTELCFSSFLPGEDFAVQINDLLLLESSLHLIRHG